LFGGLKYQRTTIYVESSQVIQSYTRSKNEITALTRIHIYEIKTRQESKTRKSFQTSRSRSIAGGHLYLTCRYITWPAWYLISEFVIEKKNHNTHDLISHEQLAFLINWRIEELIPGLLLGIEEASDTFDLESNERFIWEVKKNTINTRNTIVVLEIPFFNMVLLHRWSLPVRRL